jgi:hypothetical protein
MQRKNKNKFVVKHFKSIFIRNRRRNLFKILKTKTVAEMENFVNQMQEEVGAFDKLYLRKIQVKPNNRWRKEKTIKIQQKSKKGRYVPLQCQMLR